MNELFASLFSEARRELLTILLANPEMTIMQLSQYASSHLNIIRYDLEILCRVGIAYRHTQDGIVRYGVRNPKLLQAVFDSATRLVEVA